MVNGDKPDLLPPTMDRIRTRQINFIRIAVMKHGLNTQKQIADVVGTTPSDINQIISKNSIRLRKDENVFGLAEKFAVDPSEFDSEVEPCLKNMNNKQLVSYFIKLRKRHKMTTALPLGTLNPESFTEKIIQNVLQRMGKIAAERDAGLKEKVEALEAKMEICDEKLDRILEQFPLPFNQRSRKEATDTG
jgi:hypothetical protein